MTILTTIKDQAVKIFNAITDTGGNHLTPVAKLSINGKPFNTDALSRIISISLTDKSGFEADELTSACPTTTARSPCPRSLPR